MMPSTFYEMVALNGGLDLVTPTLNLRPGVARDAMNFECSVTGGYTRIPGYERFDGRAAPTATAAFLMLAAVFSAGVSIGATVVGNTSGATGYVIATTATALVVTATTGTFQNGETLKVGGSPVGTLVSYAGAASTAKQSAVYAQLAANYYRSLIGVVPGSGPIRGVAYLNGTVYAWRDNVGATAMAIYSSSASGWQAVPLYNEISFTAGGTAAPAEGSTLTKGAVTATVKRVVLTSGTWASNTAAGRLIVTNPSGGSFGAGAATAGATNLTLSGAQTAITLLPGGRVEAVTSNFGGAGGAARLYGCDGVNRGFEFDGMVYVPISTGMSPDTPKHVATFKNYLFYSFGASIQFSGLGTPYAWSVLLGAGEFAAGEGVTNLMLLPGSQSGGALLVQTRSTTQILYGSSAANFSLVSYNVGTGAIDYTAQNMSGTYSLDDRGVMGLNSTLAYGNFDQATLTANIRPFIVSHRSEASASSVNREKSQYRVFFSSGYGLYCTIVNDKFAGAMPVLFPDPVRVIWEDQDTSGNEVSYFGSDSGYVFSLDVGTSFDGQSINSWITLNYDAIKSPRVLKRFRKAAAEIQGSTYAEINVSYSLGYGKSEYAPQLQASYATSFAVNYWDSGLAWDSGWYFDGRTLAPSEIELDGTAENIAMTLASNSDYFGSFTVNSLLLHYTPRRGLR